MEFSCRLSEIENAAKAVYKRYNRFKVWAFDAEMGAGKTTFIHALCSLLGVKEAVTSPTFALINEYASNIGVVCHMDWYRIKNEEEAMLAGVEDYLYAAPLCLVEWPQKAAGLLPPETLYIHLNIVNDITRNLKIELPDLHEKN